MIKVCICVLSLICQTSWPLPYHSSPPGHDYQNINRDPTPLPFGVQHPNKETQGFNNKGTTLCKHYLHSIPKKVPVKRAYSHPWHSLR